MRKIILVIYIVICLSKIVIAQNTFKAIIKDISTKEPLFGATVVLKGTTIGSSSDINGIIEIKKIPNGKQTIVYSHVGFEKLELIMTFPLPDSLQGKTIFLKPSTEEMQKIIVTTTRTNSRIEDIPIRIEVIGHEEVNEEVNIKPTNISKLLFESTSIQAQHTSPINENVSIRLQGLDGKYTQILKDGFPLYSWFAQGLSIMQIPPLDLKQVEIKKGLASSLYGSDAIAGIINLISKQPLEKRELTFLVNQTSLHGTDVNGYFSQRWEKIGFSFLASNNFQKNIDVNKNGFSDLPETKTISINPTFYYYFNSTSMLRFGLTGTYDYRKGGDMNVLENKSDIIHQFFEENVSKRISSQLEFNNQLKNSSLFTIKNSFSYFDRTINNPTSAFRGSQISTLCEIAYNYKIANHHKVTGINFNSEKFSKDITKSNLQRNYNYNTLGIFIQDDWKPTEKISIQTGIRTDHQNKYGVFILPRFAFKYKFNNNFYLRAGSGFGYKVPSIFSTTSEQEWINNIQPLLLNIKAEKAIGGNFDFNYKTQRDDESFISFNQSFFITQITNPLVLDSFVFVNKYRPILTSGFESNLRYNLDEFQIFVGYTYVNSRRKYNDVQSFVPLTPKHKLTLDIIYEEEGNYSIAFEGYYISSMFRDFDAITKPYFTIGLIAQKHFNHFTLIANGENLLDVRQTRFEDIIIPPIKNPKFRQLYAPFDGRVLM